jgi:hypothetical protein
MIGCVAGGDWVGVKVGFIMVPGYGLYVFLEDYLNPARKERAYTMFICTFDSDARAAGISSPSLKKQLLEV